MGDVHGGDPELLLDLPQLRPHLHPEFGVQVAEGLIQQQDLLPHHQRPGKGHPLLLAAGELLREPPIQSLEVEHLQHLRHLAVLFLLGRLFQLQAVGDVLIHRHVGKQRILLEHQRRIALEGRQPVHPLAVHQDVALLRLGKPRQLAHQGGLAAAGGAQQRHERPLGDL